MKKLLNVTPHNKATDVALLALRLGITLMMFTHGLPKMNMLFSDAPVQFPPVLGLSAEFSLALAVLAEVICSVFIALGLGTRLATLPLIATMLVAAFVIHAADPFSIQEASLQYLLVYIVLLFTGAGRYSLDYMLLAKNQHEAAANHSKETLAYQR